MYRLVLIIGIFCLTIAFAAETNDIQPYYPLEESSSLQGVCIPSRINIASSWDFFIKGGFLYWNAKKDANEYALSTTQPLNNPPVGSRALRPKALWKPGLKIALGGTINRDAWTVEAQWTYLLGKAHGASNAPRQGYLMPLHISALSRLAHPGAQNISTHWKVYYHTADLFIGKPYYLSSWVVLNPICGFRGAWIKDKLRTQLTAITETGAVAINTLTETFNQRMWYLGPRVGINTNWLLGYGARVFTDFAGAILFANGRLSKRATSTNYASTLGYANNEVLDLRAKKRNALRTNFNAAFGFAWGTYFDEQNWYIDLLVGYQFNYWNDYLSGISSTQENFNTNSGSLYLHGLTSTIRLDF